MGMSNEELLNSLQQMIDAAEKRMAEMCGMQLYKKREGFTQEDIYTLCGRDDAVATITLNPESEGYSTLGEDITVCFAYTPKERKALEEDSSSMNGVPRVKAKALLPDYDAAKAELLLNTGVNPNDIIQMLVYHGTKLQNTFYSQEKRSPNVLEIPFEAEGGGRDIGWMYGALVRFREKGIAITPDEYSEYLAYKLVLDKDGMTEEERNQVFDKEGLINNNDVAWEFLNWKKEAGKLTDKDRHNLAHLKIVRVKERLGKLDELLKGVGGLKRFSEKYPDKAELIVKKVLGYRQHRYNAVGRHLLYLDLEGFIHIYLRHVEELSISGLYPERTKFQLGEKDVEIAIDHVMHALNDEYQIFRENNPDRQFRKYSDQAYYYNGDYYELRVEPNGRLIQFFKIGGRSYLSQ